MAMTKTYTCHTEFIPTLQRRRNGSPTMKAISLVALASSVALNVSNHAKHVTLHVFLVRQKPMFYANAKSSASRPKKHK